MPSINLNAIQSGMILSEDVKHANGRVLLRAGSELTDQHIKIFKTWGVQEVVVKSLDAESGTSKQHTPDEILAVENKQRFFFQHCDLTHPLMAALFRISVQTALEQDNGAQ